MWKRDERDDVSTENPAPRTGGIPKSERTARISGSGERATIGRSIAIRGDVTGDEDLLIQGRVDGSVNLEEHSVTVGPEGEVKASIVARVITVEGRVEGDLTAAEQAFLRNSAWVQGDITAPRVVLDDGARFLGSVDMGDSSDRGRKASGPSNVQERKALEVGRSEPSKPMVTSEEAGKKAATPTIKAAATESEVKAGT